MLQEEVNYIQCQMTQNTRTLMNKQKGLYTHQPNTANTVHLVCKLQIQNRIGGVEWR